jgi:hypothetical protein
MSEQEGKNRYNDAVSKAMGAAMDKNPRDVINDAIIERIGITDDQLTKLFDAGVMLVVPSEIGVGLARNSGFVFSFLEEYRVEGTTNEFENVDPVDIAIRIGMMSSAIMDSIAKELLATLDNLNDKSLELMKSAMFGPIIQDMMLGDGDEGIIDIASRIANGD